MTTAADIVDLVEATLLKTGATDAGNRVYRPGDWPAQPDSYPLIKLRVVSETKQSITRSGSVQFTTTLTLRILGEVSAPVSLDDPAGTSAAEAALLQLSRQIEVAVIGSYPLQQRIQHIASVSTQFAFDAEGATHLAGIQKDLAIEFYQDAEDFAQPDTDDLDRVTIGDHLDLDLAQ